jgi:hypothetical protein
VYFGGMMFPEVNIKKVWEYFVMRKFAGYLLYATDAVGNLKKYPGFNSQRESKQELFTLHKSHISLHAQREMHLPIISQQLNIKGLSDMTHYDLFTAAGGALMGSASRMRNYMREMETEEEENSENKYFDTYTF